ncbi:MAG TPA: hypothetical protein VMW20_06390 [Candidatus Nanoarchaeia archaeon]|nr:hypothetical protein [Candidatus Nanoarchaeia archaeon]
MGDWKVKEFDLDTIVDPGLRKRMQTSRALTIKRSGKRLNFYITSGTFPSISITGSQCGLNCKHCGGKLLERLIPCMSPDTLIDTARKLDGKGAKGILVTGGCNSSGKVPVASMSDAIKTIKDTTDLTVIAHTGFITPEEAYILKDSGLDGIGFDVVGDMNTAKRVYGLEVDENDYISSLDALSNADMMLFPHICVGLDGGRMKGELHALEMIKGRKVTTIVITGLMPVAGTEFSEIKPDPIDFAKVITEAVEMFSQTPITLGCARSSGRDRELIDHLAIESGVENIAIPTQYAVRYGVNHGYEMEYYGTCCGLPPSKYTRIPQPGVVL